MSLDLNTINTVTLPEEPLSATQEWRAAVAAAGGQCVCTTECGRSHKSFPGGRCPDRLGLGARLHVAQDGRVYCSRCFGLIDRAATKQAAEAKASAAAQAYVQDDLFSLLG